MEARGHERARMIGLGRMVRCGRGGAMWGRGGEEGLRGKTGKEGLSKSIRCGVGAHCGWGGGEV